MANFLNYEGLSAYNSKIQDLFTVTTPNIITVPESAWTDLTAEVTDEFFLMDDKYSYLFGPTKDSKFDYRTFGIDPVEITAGHKLILSAKKQPTNDISIEILRLEA